MPQLVEPITPDAQRAVIRQSLDEIGHRSRNRPARCTFGLFGLYHSSELRGIGRQMACPLDPPNAN